jgi:hypothetical protein
VIQTAYNSSQQELKDLRDAALEACQSVEERVSFNCRFVYAVVSFRLFLLLGRILAGIVRFSRVAQRQSGEGEEPYPAGGVGYPRLARLRYLAARVLRKFVRSPGQDVLSAFTVKLFLQKMGPFLGGSTPVVALEETWFSERKLSRP